jgi:hypothetical protein
MWSITRRFVRSGPEVLENRCLTEIDQRAIVPKNHILEATYCFGESGKQTVERVHERPKPLGGNKVQERIGYSHGRLVNCVRHKN